MASTKLYVRLAMTLKSGYGRLHAEESTSRHMNFRIDGIDFRKKESKKCPKIK